MTTTEAPTTHTYRLVALNRGDARWDVTIAGTYVIGGEDAGRGVWTWPADHTATIDRETP